MQAGSVKLSYPVLRYNTIIRHCTDRSATALEWLLLEIIAKTSESNKYAETSLGEILEILLGLNGVDKLIKPCLINLGDSGVIKTSLLTDDMSLHEIMLRDITLTDEGKKLQVNGMIPGEIEEDSIIMPYDILRRKYIFDKIQMSDEPEGTVVLEPPKACDAYYSPEKVLQHLRELQESNSKEYKWLKRNTHILGSRLDEGNSVCKWNNQTQSISLDENLHLSMDGEFADNNILERILLTNTSFDLPEAMESDMVNLHVPRANGTCGASEFFTMDKLEYRINDAFRECDSRLIITNAIYAGRIVHKAKKSKGKSKGKEKRWEKVYVLLGRENFASMDFSQNYIVIHTDAGMTENMPGLVFLSRDKLIKIGEFAIHAGNVSRDVHMGYFGSMDSQRLEYIFSCIIDSIGRPGLNSILAAHAAGFKDLCQEYFHSFVDDAETLDDKYYRINNVNNECKKAFHEVLADEAIMHKIFVDDIVKKLLSHESVSIDHVISELEALAATKVYRSGESYFTDILVAILPSIDAGSLSLEKVWALWRVVAGVNAKSMNIIKSGDAWCALYPEHVISSMMERFVAADEGWQEYIPLEALLGKLRKSNVFLAGIFGPMDGLFSPRFICDRSFANKGMLSNIYNYVQAWTDTWNDLERRYPSLQVIIAQNPYISSINQNMAQIMEEVAKFFDKDFLKFDKVYVIDTCALVNNPDIISAFAGKKKCVLIVPVTVLTELDNLKDKEYGAREAIRQISMNSQEEWLHLASESYLDLLPDDYDKQSNDIRILSVAVKHYTRKPVLITDDTNLKNLAVSQNIDSISGKSALKSLAHNTGKSTRRK